MNTTRPTIAGAVAALAIPILISLFLVACSGDEVLQQSGSQVQQATEESDAALAQQANESQQQQSQRSNASAVQHEQEQSQQQSYVAQQQQQAPQQAEQEAEQQQQAAHQQQEEQQDVAEMSETPSVSPSETVFEDYEESVWAQTEEDGAVTFALDADQASWALALSYAEQGFLIEPASVRAEEWINAQYYAYPLPKSDREFGVSLDLIEHPLATGEKHLLRIGLQAPLIEQTRQVNVIFVVDASGSMLQGDRVFIAGETLRTIIAGLRPDVDRAGIIQFSVDPIPSSFVPHTRPDSEFLQASIDRLLPYYGTNVQAGLDLGVQLANDAREAWPDSDNYVVLISDGVANVDATDPFAILESAVDVDESNPLRLITIGVGLGHYNDVLLEQLAQYGNGWYYYIDSVEQAYETFAPANWLRLSTPFADQTRAQIQWNPETVRAWRVIGYENRRTGDETFAEDRKEFAELQSGTAVTIFVELELTAEARDEVNRKLNLGEFAVRWLTPRSDESNRQETTLAVGLETEPDPLLQLGAIVALAADRYGSLEYVGEPATPEVNGSLEHLRALLHQLTLDWPAELNREALEMALLLLETLTVDTSD